MPRAKTTNTAAADTKLLQQQDQQQKQQKQQPPQPAMRGKRSGLQRDLEQDLVLKYSAVKQLITSGEFTHALQQAWALLEDVKAAACPQGPGRDSRCLQELFVAASLNVAVCSAEVQHDSLPPLSSLNDAMQGLLGVLRDQPDAAAEQHACMLAKCLVKIAKTLGQGMAATSVSAELEDNLQHLLLLMVSAAQMCGQPGLSQQVASKACQHLPSDLQYCMLVALIHAAGISRSHTLQHSSGLAQDRSWRAGGKPLLPASVAVACLHHLACKNLFTPGCIAACVARVLPVPSQALPQPDLCLVLAALCQGHCSQLPSDTFTAISAATESVMRSARPLGNAPAQHLPSRRQGSSKHGSSVPLATHEVSSAIGSRISQDDAAVPLDHAVELLRLQAWCMDTLLAAGSNFLAPLCPFIVSTACSAAATLDAAETQQQLECNVKLTARLLGAAAGCLSFCWLHEQQLRSQQDGCLTTGAPAAAAAAAGAFCASSSYKQGFLLSRDDRNARGWLLLHQLTAAVQDLIAWQVLQQPHGAGNNEALERCTPDICAWLQRKLHAAAQCACGSNAPAAGAKIQNAAAAALWLLALQCSCAAARAAAAVGAAVLGTVSSDSNRQQLSGAAAAAQDMLQLTRPYLSCAIATVSTGCCMQWRTDTQASEEQDDPASTSRNPPAPSFGSIAVCAAPCICLSAQEVMQVIARLMLELSDADQQHLEQQWQATLRSFARLRCAAATAMCLKHIPVTSDADVSLAADDAGGSSSSSACSSDMQANTHAHHQLQAVQQQCILKMCGKEQQLAPLPLLQLAARMMTPAVAAANQSSRHPRLDRLCWMEGVALLQVHAARGGLDEAAAATAVRLLQGLADISRALARELEMVQKAEMLMAHSMVLLLLKQTAVRDGRPDISCSFQGQAGSALTQACAAFGELHTMGCTGRYQAQDSCSCAMISTTTSAGHATRAVQGRSCSNTSKLAAVGRRQASAVARLHPGARTAMDDTVQGHAACSTCGNALNADAMACAALCHCLLALVLAEDALISGMSSPAASLHSVDNPLDITTGLGTCAGDGSVAARFTCPEAEGYATSWQPVATHMQQCSAVLEACMPTAQSAGGDSSGCMHTPAIFFVEETAAAVMQAWHVAGLQDWWTQQHMLYSMLERLSSTAPQRARQQLQPLLPLLHPGPGGRCCSWLSNLVLQQQCWVGTEQSPGCGTCADDDTSHSPEQQQLGCCCQLQQHYQTLTLRSVQGWHQDGGMSWSLLRQTQMQLAAAEAATQAGDTATAAVAAELALQRCRSMLQQTTSAAADARAVADNSTHRSSTPSLPRANVGLPAALTACTLWHALGLYMSGMWQLAAALDAAGNPHDAVRTLKELFRVSHNSRCFGFAALSQACMACVYRRMAETDKSATAAAAAEAMLQGMGAQQQLHPQIIDGKQTQQSALYALVSANVAGARAAVASCKQQCAEQQAHLHAGIMALQEANNSHAAQHVRWQLIHKQAYLLVQLAQAQMALGTPDEAQANLRHAVALLEDAGGTGCHRCLCGPWPIAWATAQLQLLALCQPQVTACNSGNILVLAGFQSGGHSNDLHAAFCRAAKDAPQPVGGCADASEPVTTRMSLRKARSAAQRAQQASSLTVGAAGNSTGGVAAGALGRTRASKLATNGSEASLTHTSHTRSIAGGSDTMLRFREGTSIVAWICSVLPLMPLIAQQSLLLRPACAVLSHALSAVGSVAAAAMLQHMSVGVSTTQQQLQLVTQQLLLHAQTPLRGSDLDPSSFLAPATNGAVGRDWSAVQPPLAYTHVLQQMADAAEQATRASNMAATPTCLVRAVDDTASQWLQAALQQLPPGTAVCSITCCPAAASTSCGLLLSPTPSGSQLPDGAAAHGIVVSRVILASDGSLTTPLMVQLPLPAEHDRLHQKGLCGLLGDLHVLLSDSAASMASSTGLCSPAAKATWWRQRVAQDKRMAALLQQLDQHMLGPWRCLLMQPGQPAVEAAVTAASWAFVSECFDSVLDDRPKHLLRQLVGLLLVHYDTLSMGELTRALQDLSIMAQQRQDGLHLQRLLVELQAAHDTVSQTTTAAPPPPSSSRPHVKGQGSQQIGVATLLQAKQPAQQHRPQRQHGSTPCSNKNSADSSPGPHRGKNCHAAGAAAATATPTSKVRRSAAGATAAAVQQRRVVRTTRLRVAAAACATPVHSRLSEAAHGAAEATEDASSPRVALPVPPSIARHASRRGRLNAMTASKCSQQAAGGGADMQLQRAAAPDAMKTHEDAQAVPVASSAPADKQPLHRECCLPAADHGAAAARMGLPTIGSTSPDSGSTQAPSAASFDGSSFGEPWLPSVVLALCDTMQQLPWESCAGLSGQNTYRCPGLFFAAALSEKVHSSHPEDGVLRLSHSFYLLNPEGDLPATQQTFEDTLHRLCEKGFAGHCPTPEHMLAALQQHDLFLYFGHGAADQHVPLPVLRRMDRCAASVLMGCSSGRLRSAGVYEANGPVWSYLLAGSPAVIANLWDVTDRDIDRLAGSLLECWTQAAASQSPSAHACKDASNHTRVGQRTSGTDEACSLSRVSSSLSVANSRRACRLPHLIGAAAVCYGLPACAIDA